MVRLTKRDGFEETCESGAARSICLEHVDSSCFQHSSEVPRVVSVLTGGDIHSGRSAIANQAQTVDIVGGDRLLEPCNVGVSEDLSLLQGLLAAVGAVGVDEQLRIFPDGIASHPHALDIGPGIASDLHL